jgi:hypothetical protein
MGSSSRRPTTWACRSSRLDITPGSSSSSVARRPPNIKPWQLLRSYRLTDAWKRAGSGEERAAVLALALHLHFREHQQSDHPAYEDGKEIILTNKWMRGLLREVGAENRGEKAARRAIRFLTESGVLEDTGRTMKPKRSAQAIARAEKFQRMNSKRGGSIATEGGARANPRGSTPTGGVSSASQNASSLVPWPRSGEERPEANGFCRHERFVKRRFRSRAAPRAPIRAPFGGPFGTPGLHERACLTSEHEYRARG